ncbi:MAG: hypothetical protein LUG12_13500 [Erysipelotrichaceae bacterium]|nr:hypothetical protein [Erysipelotrichaceae bacterium]
MSQEGKYIVFIDDVDQIYNLKAILSYISSLSPNYEVKLIFTIRNYAMSISNILSTIYKYSEYKIFNLNEFKNDEIENILKENLNIYNYEYLDQITNIAKGNIRLAILAGNLLKSEGYIALKDSSDLFIHYYSNMLNNVLSKDEIIVIFVIAFLNTVELKNCNKYQKILELVDINIKEFIEITKELNSEEIIDIYMGNVAKIYDQSFSDYILYYVLIEKKLINLSDLIQISMIHFKKKISYAINTIVTLFNSDDTKNFIRPIVNKCWNNADEKLQYEYLKAFYRFNLDRTLYLLQKKIEKNEYNLDDTEINILLSLKYTNHYIDALQLLIRYLNLHPDIRTNSISNYALSLSFDQYSYKYNYKIEYQIIDQLWNFSNNGNNVAATTLLLETCKCMLNCHFDVNEFNYDNTFSFVTFNLSLSPAIEKLRHHIWEILSILYNNEIYKNKIIDIIISNHISKLDSKEQQIKFLNFDLQCIEEHFYNQMQTLSLKDFEILHILYKQAKRLNLENHSVFKKMKDNNEFTLYQELVKDYPDDKIFHRSKERVSYFKTIFENYDGNNFLDLFKLLKKCETNNDHNKGYLLTSLEVIFSLFENQPQLYFNVIDCYLSCGAPYTNSNDSYNIINKLLGDFAFNSIKKLVYHYEFSYKHIWICNLWELMPEHLIDDNAIQELLNFVDNETKDNNPYIPNILYLEKYQNIDPSFIVKISNILINNSKINPNMITSYLHHCYDEEADNLIFKLYDNNLDIFEQIYLITIKDYYDYDGKLFAKLLKKDSSFCDKFYNDLCENDYKTPHADIFFNIIWEQDNYKEYINNAFKKIIGNSITILNISGAETIFINNHDTSKLAKNHKKLWINEYIKQNITNPKNINLIFDVIATYQAKDKKEHILNLVKYTKDIEIFKGIQFFPIEEGFMGSEVPIINEKIEFLEDLINSLNGLDYIEHREYLNNKIEALHKYKNDVEVREFVERNNQW